MILKARPISFLSPVPLVVYYNVLHLHKRIAFAPYEQMETVTEHLGNEVTLPAFWYIMSSHQH